MGKRYFPNKWNKYNKLPADNFQSISFEDFMDHKVAGWLLRDDIICVVRARDLFTDKVTEHAYRRMSAAEERVRKYINDRTHEVVICADEALYYVNPEMIDDDAEFK